ncbi:MAG: AI-2E family transporter [Sulfurimonas sp. RIFCSPHIGHO2_12_FULL_36_9]|uniref:AI-2E family transporter n=1 Tax=Sulfurimonas sp. RIFCSPLOWO2_12_36_12 TaxID=1802253 RepID=UPI0008B10084|nr:AI-2E family transporter [Sulfurimonas sp. RIFCSPLOWO2_12_36_12]OHD96962.1 MAG: AI-2E family transporter [Sulfurimonas sp. RIFCSPLOWO2_02_FULL_36_28]OHD97213.1 MAG: AI-2E family transporter [Sulfurimonas sp. RIFCSPHIGHO2_12_FULL_36_9]OHE03048.1 MAG: AI-2E family transporter [Sulfurimonas sp. RIFCSPLOWO2_12_36_12]OHE08239.1 MAG: AI-2E family transporter [Sulfurimonas sp. RIFCSPLOWO2_12_FULL_36_74]
MKPQYFVAILFATSLYWMYLLYTPFLLGMIIAALLAISTANIQNFFEKVLKSKFLAALSSSFLLAVLFFVPLGYFLVTLTVKINGVEPIVFENIEMLIKDFLANPPEYLQFLKPYMDNLMKDISVDSIAAYALTFTGDIGSLSAGYLKNSFLVIVFYFFAQYNGGFVVDLLKRVVQMSVDETTLLAKELSSVMSVVFYSIIVNAMFQGLLFGVAISFMGYNGLLFGIMYGFASLIPVVGGALMWLPFMLFEFSMGNSSNALFIALYSILLISVIADTFIKPLIIKEINLRVLKEDDARMNELIIFFAIIAGLTTFGFWGMILGPAITAFFLTILKLFEARTKECESNQS